MGKGVGSAVITAFMVSWLSFLPGQPSRAEDETARTALSLWNSVSESIETYQNPSGWTHEAQAGNWDRKSGPGSPPTAAAGPSKASGSAKAETIVLPDLRDFSLLSRDPLDQLRLEPIKPLYTSPAIAGEGIWQSADTPRDSNGVPVVYTSFYRPSVQFPNAVVYMMLVDMSRAFVQFYVGSQEPAARLASSEIEPDLRSRIIAVTNAMWMQRHSGGAGAIFRGRVLYPMVDGMATLIIYKDGSADIQEWSSDIPIGLVQDARQLRHLIVKNGMVVRTVLRKGRVEDSEIGLGFLLGGGGRDFDGQHAWFVAHRSAFGIRKDGNIVFAIGHHIGTQDLSKALVLAGCERAIHADANPHNIVGNFYLRDPAGSLVRKAKLSPEQTKYQLNRYDEGYTKDFFVFFLRTMAGSKGRAFTRKGTLNSNHP